MLRKVKWRKRRKDKERKGGKEGRREEVREKGRKEGGKKEEWEKENQPGALSSTFPELDSWSSIHIGFSSHLLILSGGPSFPPDFRPKHLSWPQFPQPTSNLSEYRWLCFKNTKVKVLVAQSCQTLCDSMDYSPSGSSVHGILQARILKWVAIPFSRGSSQPRDWTWVSWIAGRFFTVWATREVSKYKSISNTPSTSYQHHHPLSHSDQGSSLPGVPSCLHLIPCLFST